MSPQSDGFGNIANRLYIAANQCSEEMTDMEEKIESFFRDFWLNFIFDAGMLKILIDMEIRPPYGVWYSISIAINILFLTAATFRAVQLIVRLSREKPEPVSENNEESGFRGRGVALTGLMDGLRSLTFFVLFAALLISGSKAGVPQWILYSLIALGSGLLIATLFAEITRRRRLV